MSEYRVVWVIEVEADSHEDAAAEALAIHRDPQSSATVFNVSLVDPNGEKAPEKVIDLMELDASYVH